MALREYSFFKVLVLMTLLALALCVLSLIFGCAKRQVIIEEEIITPESINRVIELTPEQKRERFHRESGFK